jgi:hypothetical protein
MGRLRLEPVFSEDDITWAKDLLKDAERAAHDSHTFYDYEEHEDPRFIANLLKHAAELEHTPLQVHIRRKRQTIELDFTKTTEEIVAEAKAQREDPEVPKEPLIKPPEIKKPPIASGVPSTTVLPSSDQMERKRPGAGRRRKGLIDPGPVTKQVEKIKAVLEEAGRPMNQEEIMERANLRVWPQRLPGIQKISLRGKATLYML